MYVIGAVSYFVAREFLELPFTASPLFVGVVMLVASVFRRRLLASAVLLLTWGTAILINGRGPLEAGRTAALYITAFGLGAGILLVLRGGIESRVALESVAIVMAVAGVWFYLAYDYPALERPWLWSAALLISAAGLVAGEMMQRQGATKRP